MTPRLLERVTELMAQQTKLMNKIVEQLPLYNQDLIQRAIDETDDDEDFILDGAEPLAQEEIN